MNADCNTKAVPAFSENVVPPIKVMVLGLFSVFPERLVTPQLQKTLQIWLFNTVKRIKT